MTDTDRKIDAFRMMYNGIALPFGGALGALLTNVAGKNAQPAVRTVPWGVAFKFGFCLLGLLAFFLSVLVTCEAIIRRRAPHGRWLGFLVIGTLIWIATIMPAQEFGIPYRLWLATAGAWLVSCLTLCWLCSAADLKKSMF